MALTKTNIINLALSKLGSERLTLSDSEITANTISHAKTVNLHYEQTLGELTRMHSWNCCKKRQRLSPYEILVETQGGNVASIGGGTGTTLFASETLSFAGRPKYFTDPTVTTGLTISFDYQNYNSKGDKGVWGISGLASAAGDGTTSTGDLTGDNTYTPVGHTYSGGADHGVVSVTSVKPDFEYDFSFALPTDAIRSFYLTNSAEVYKFMKPRVDWVIEGNAILTNEEKVFLCYDGIPDPVAMDSLFAQAFITLLAARMAIPITGDLKMYEFLLQEFNSVIMPEARRVNGTERLDPPTIDSEWLEATYTSNSSYNNSYPPFSQTSYGSFS